MNYPKALSLLSLLFLVLFSTSALACRCSELNALEALDYEHHKFIFTGTVAFAKLMDPKDSFTAVVAEVIVDEQFKGSIEDERFNITTLLDTSACGGPMSVGSRYIFVANDMGDIDFCTSRKIKPYEADWYTTDYIDALRRLSKEQNR